MKSFSEYVSKIIDFFEYRDKLQIFFGIIWILSLVLFFLFAILPSKSQSEFINSIAPFVAIPSLVIVLTPIAFLYLCFFGFIIEYFLNFLFRRSNRENYSSITEAGIGFGFIFGFIIWATWKAFTESETGTAILSNGFIGGCVGMPIGIFIFPGIYDLYRRFRKKKRDL